MYVTSFVLACAAVGIGLVLLQRPAAASYNTESTKQAQMSSDPRYWDSERRLYAFGSWLKMDPRIADSGYAGHTIPPTNDAMRIQWSGRDDPILQYVLQKASDLSVHVTVEYVPHSGKELQEKIIQIWDNKQRFRDLGIDLTDVVGGQESDSVPYATGDPDLIVGVSWTKGHTPDTDVVAAARSLVLELTPGFIVRVIDKPPVFAALPSVLYPPPTAT